MRGAPQAQVSPALFPPLALALVVKAKDLNGVSSAAGQGYIWMAHRQPHSEAWQLAACSKKMWEDGYLQLTREDPVPQDVEWQVRSSRFSAAW